MKLKIRAMVDTKNTMHNKTYLENFIVMVRTANFKVIIFSSHTILGF